MNIPSFSVNRPIFTVMVTFIIIILGFISLWRVPIDLMPDTTYPALSVSTTYENASPEEMEELVTRRIEEAISAVPGVEEVTSNSMEGLSNVRISFSWGTDLDAASNDVRDRLDRVIPQLPDECDRPTLRKFDLASIPILMLGVSSKLDPVRLRDIIDDQIKYRLERTPGVASIDVNGGLEREIHVNLWPDKVKALGMSLDQVIKAIRDSNVRQPAGIVDRGNYEIAMRTPGEYSNLEELLNVVVTIRDGAPILLREIAEVKDTWQKPRRIVRIDGESGVRLAVYKQSGKNTVEVAEEAIKEINRINADIPQIKIAVIIDTSDYIKRSISNVSNSAIYGGLLAILILLCFLRHIPSTLVIGISIPTSIIATFVLVYFYGFTLNLMTLGGLALGVGMLVDNSIVVLENIYRLREENGLEPKKAAIDGSAEVLAAIIASTLTTLVVFLPLIFVKGMAGVMFKQLAWVVSFSLLCSLVVAVSVVPTLAARFVGKSLTGKEGKATLGQKLYRLTGWFLDGIDNDYKGFLHFCLNHKVVTLVFSVAILGGSLALIPRIGVELMPATDESEVRVTAEMEVGVRLGFVEERLARMEEMVRKAVPEIRNMVTTVAGSGWHASGSNIIEMRIALKPVSQRTRSSEDIAAALRKTLANIPGASVRTRSSQGLMGRITRGGGQEKIELEIRGHDFETADQIAKEVKRVAEDVDGVTDTVLSRDAGGPEELVVVDRHKAADLNLTVSDVANAMKTIVAGTKAGNFRESGKEYSIVVKVEGADRMSLDEIMYLTTRNTEGDSVVLRNLTQIESRRGPLVIERRDQERVTTLAVNIHGRDMGSIIADLREKIRTIPIPRNFSIEFAGEYEEQQKSFRELLLSLGLSLIMVYMVMACQYESLRDPFVVMFSVPLAVIGVSITLFLTNTTFNVQSFIGCIMLGGIVVNNAILLVDHTNLLRQRDHFPIREAIEEASRRRLRPILMTTTTTLLGLLPLALGIGEGAEAQAPLARAVIGGLTSSTLITLVFVPVLYSIFEGSTEKKADEGKQNE